MILDGRKMTFWTTYFFCPYTSLIQQLVATAQAVIPPTCWQTPTGAQRSRPLHAIAGNLQHDARAERRWKHLFIATLTNGVYNWLTNNRIAR